MSILTAISHPRFGFINTYGVTMFYYAQHTRPITDYKRACERSSGAAAPLAVARAVNELQAAGLRLAPARQLVAGLNDKSASLMYRDMVTLTISAVVATADCAKTDFVTVCDNKLIRSIKYYRALRAKSEEREGVFKGGYPFMFISPFDLKLIRGEAGTFWR